MPEGSQQPEPKGDPTWGPYPGDELAPPPTPQAPEIPMSEGWPWVAGIAVALRILVPIVLGLIVVGIVVAALLHWL